MTMFPLTETGVRSFRSEGMQLLDSREDILEKLRKIEALFAGAATEGEKRAADAARERIRARLDSLKQEEAAVEFRMSIDNPWSRKLFSALARRYGVKPYRYSGQKRTSIMISAPRSFVDSTLMPEFQRFNEVLVQHLTEIAEEIIASAVAPDAGEVEERRSIGAG